MKSCRYDWSRLRRLWPWPWISCCWSTFPCWRGLVLRSGWRWVKEIFRSHEIYQSNFVANKNCSWTICKRKKKNYEFFFCFLLMISGFSVLILDSMWVQRFERLGNLARERFAPVWSPSKLFMLKNLIIKSLQKIRLENIQNRRPHGSLIKHGGFWDFWMCRASADDQSPDIPFEIWWI